MDDTRELKVFEGNGIEIVEFLNVANMKIEVEPAGFRKHGTTVIASALPVDAQSVDLYNVDEIFVCKLKKPCSSIVAVVETSESVEYRVSGRDVEITITKPLNCSLVLKGKRLGIIRDFVITPQIDSGDLIIAVQKVDKPLFARIGSDGVITIHRKKS